MRIRLAIIVVLGLLPAVVHLSQDHGFHKTSLAALGLTALWPLLLLTGPALTGLWRSGLGRVLALVALIPAAAGGWMFWQDLPSLPTILHLIPGPSVVKPALVVALYALAGLAVGRIGRRTK